MKLEINTAKTTQSAIPELKREEKTLYFLIIGSDENKTVLNVGEKTYKTITETIKNEEFKPNEGKVDNTPKKR